MQFGRYKYLGQGTPFCSPTKKQLRKWKVHFICNATHDDWANFSIWGKKVRGDLLVCSPRNDSSGQYVFDGPPRASGWQANFYMLALYASKQMSTFKICPAKI